MSLAYNGYIQEGVFKGLSYNAGVFFDRTRNELTKYGTDYIDSSKGLIYKEGFTFTSRITDMKQSVFSRMKQDVANSPKQFNDKTLPGDIKYADISIWNGVPDGVVDENDRKVLDGRLPDFEYTVNLAASWKGFDLSLMGQGVQGVKHYASGWGLRPSTRVHRSPQGLYRQYVDRRAYGC